MSIFRSKHHEAGEAISAKLATARNNLAAAEQQLQELALSAAIGEDATSLERYDDAKARVAALRQHIELLEFADTEASRLERGRLEKARSEAEKSRVRAMRTHVSTIVGAARDYERAVTLMRDALDQMIEHSRKVLALANPASDGERNLQVVLSPRMVERRLSLEISRQSAVPPHHPGSGPDLPRLPGAKWSGHGEFVPWQKSVREVAPLSVSLEQALLGAVGTSDKPASAVAPEPEMETV